MITVNQEIDINESIFCISQVLSNLSTKLDRINENQEKNYNNVKILKEKYTEIWNRIGENKKKEISLRNTLEENRNTLVYNTNICTKDIEDLSSFYRKKTQQIKNISETCNIFRLRECNDRDKENLEKSNKKMIFLSIVSNIFAIGFFLSFHASLFLSITMGYMYPIVFSACYISSGIIASLYKNNII